MEGAIVEVKVADIVRTAKTDASGNYKIELTLNWTKYDVNTLKLEVKCSNGSGKKTETIDLTRRNVIYKDFKLNCGSKIVEPPPPSEYIYEDDYFSIIYKDFKRQGSNLQLRLIVTARNDDRNIQIAGGSNWENSTRLFDNNNNKYLVSATKIANSIAEKGQNNIMSLVKDIPTEILLTFEQFPVGANMALLELWFSNRPNFYGSYQLAKFRNLK